GDLLGVLKDVMKAQEARRGAGVRILTETVTSPTLVAQLGELLARYPQARWDSYEPAGRDNVYAGARLAFGRPVETIYRIDEADVILSLDAAFLAPGPGALRYIRDFASRRRPGPDGGAAAMNRLYVVESMPTNTGARADHRFAVRSGDIEGVARA